MKIDLNAVLAGQISLADLTRDLTLADLYQTTNELFDTLDSILANAPDPAVNFVPQDPASSEQSEQGWPLSHICAHLTATLEESAALAAMFARGVPVEERLRIEVPWQNLSTQQLVQSRLRESRRICLALLGAWPDEPHLEVTKTLIPQLGPLDARGFYLLGVVHGQGHLDQLHETLRQYTLSTSH